MKLTGFVPILKCNSVDISLGFYKDTLRFVEIKTRKSDAGLEWVYLKSDNTYLMLERCEDVASKVPESISLYFYTDDIESFYQYMSAKNYEISPVEDTGFGLRQCTFYDPDGHKIQIGQTSRELKNQ